MNPNEIKKALKCCCIEHKCGQCSYNIKSALCINNIMSDTLAYINQLEAEVKSLNTENRILSQKRFNIFERLEFTNKIRDKAIKEFAEATFKLIEVLGCE